MSALYSFRLPRIKISLGVILLVLTVEILVAFCVIVLPAPYSVMLIAGLVGLSVLYRKPILGMLLLVILLPNYGLNFFALAGESEVSILEPAVVLALFCWVIHSIRKREIRLHWSSIDVAVFFLLTCITLSLFWTPSIGRGFHHLIKVVTGLLIYYLIINLTEDKKTFSALAWTWIVLGVGLSFYGLYETMSVGLEAMSRLQVQEGYTHLGRQVRTTSVIHGPDSLGLVLNLSILVAVVTFLNASSARTKTWLGIFIVVMLLSLLATFSRKSYLGLALGMTYIIVSHKKGARIWLLGIGAIGGLLMVMYLVNPSFIEVFLDRIATYFEPIGTSISSRAKTWQMAIRLFSQKPVMGNGIGSFYTLASQLDSPLYLIHNFYIFLLCELGLMGLLAVLFWVFQVGQRLLRFRRIGENDEAKTLAIGMGAGILAITVQAGFRTFGLTDPVFWGFLGLVVAFLRVYDVKGPLGQTSSV